MKLLRNTRAEVGVVTMTISLDVFDGVGINLEISVVDLSTGEVGPAEPMRGDDSWTVGELKQNIGEVRGGILVLLSFSALP